MKPTDKELHDLLNDAYEFVFDQVWDKSVAHWHENEYHGKPGGQYNYYLETFAKRDNMLMERLTDAMFQLRDYEND